MLREGEVLIMPDMDELIEVAEMCSGYKSEPLMAYLDIKEVNCISCKKWDGEKCCSN